MNKHTDSTAAIQWVWNSPEAQEIHRFGLVAGHQGVIWFRQDLVPGHPADPIIAVFSAIVFGMAIQADLDHIVRLGEFPGIAILQPPVGALLDAHQLRRLKQGEVRNRVCAHDNRQYVGVWPPWMPFWRDSAPFRRFPRVSACGRATVGFGLADQVAEP